MSRHIVLTIITLLLMPLSVAAQGFQHRQSEQEWVDSVYATLTAEQRIAQMIIVRVPQKMNEAAERKFMRRLEQTRVGGICFFAGDATTQLRQTKRFQRDAFLPLMVCIDGEWGLGMRLKDLYSFPRQSHFDNLPRQADTLVYDMGREIGRQCRKMGIHVNFAPVVDVNSNPRNPVIGTRSFSADPERVARLGVQYMLGMQSEGVMAVAKHFPGHGDTESDSHKTLPTVNHSRAHLDSIELMPFRNMVRAGVMGVMTGHLHVPALDSTPRLPSSLSRPIVMGLLREEMGFDGLIITDGMEMKGVSSIFTSSEAAVRAVSAGNNMLLLPTDVEGTIRALLLAAKKDSQLDQQIAESCRRVLRAKYRLGLDQEDVTAGLTLPDSDDSLRCEMVLEGVRLNRDSRIDSLLLMGIERRAYPGCQMIVMHHGQVIYRRAYGDFTYDDSVDCNVQASTLYDLASVTKVLATTIAIMKLVDNNQVGLDDRLSLYLPYLRGSNKEGITIRQVMSHNARLKSFAPFWSMTNDTQEMRRLIAESELTKESGYLYSDLGFIMLADLVEVVSGLSIDRFVERYFYRPMHLKHLCYLPLGHGFDLDQIAPTEEEMNYRNKLIHGVVHDPNAYALGGVTGHAGLFGNADDVASVVQMLVDGGTYGGHRLLSQAVIDTFNTRHFAHLNNRRGLGFDKPLIHDSSQHVAPEASQQSFGHTGFTGTMIWGDPKHDLVYVFLSNRVYPSATPNLLARLNIRTDIQSLIYQDLNLK